MSELLTALLILFVCYVVCKSTLGDFIASRTVVLVCSAVFAVVYLIVVRSIV